MTPPANKGGPTKARIECPHCGGEQLESVFAKSTICRQCGKHFPIKPGGKAVPGDDEAGTGLLGRLKHWLVPERERRIVCFRCQTEQVVSTAAKSTSCRHCGTYIDVRDLRINAVFSRNIETQGTVLVVGKGDLTSAKVLCGEAVLRGRVHGSLVCTGTVRVKWKGRITGAIEARELVIERGAAVEFARAVKAGRVEVAGKVSARIMADAVNVLKKGALDGTVYAKAFAVEKGGIFHGELVIGRGELTQPELLGGAAAQGELFDGSGRGGLQFGPAT